MVTDDKATEELARITEWALFGSEDGSLLDDDVDCVPVGEYRRLIRESATPRILAALPSLGWVRAASLTVVGDSVCGDVGSCTCDGGADEMQTHRAECGLEPVLSLPVRAVSDVVEGQVAGIDTDWHFGDDDRAGGLVKHRGRRGNCAAPSCVDAASGGVVEQATAVIEAGWSAGSGYSAEDCARQLADEGLLRSEGTASGDVIEAVEGVLYDQCGDDADIAECAQALSDAGLLRSEVTDDPKTVERVAKAMWADEWGGNWSDVAEFNREIFRRRAITALRALGGDRSG